MGDTKLDRLFSAVRFYHTPVEIIGPWSTAPRDHISVIETLTAGVLRMVLQA